jgi:membrane protein required for colicin V production
MLFGFLKASIICFAFLFILHLLPVEGNLKETRNNAIAYSICKSAIVAMGYSSDEVDLRQMAKEKASELTKTITDKAKGSTEETADSLKSAAKNAADSVATKVTETAEKAKDAAIAAKDAAIKTFEGEKSSASKDSSKVKK